MNEIIRVNDNTKVNTGNTELDKCINIVYDEMRKGNKAAQNIAIQFHTIASKKLYEYTGAKSFSDFAENYFGISRSQATRLVKIASKFLIGENAAKYEEYNNTQLIEMLSATDEMLPYIKPNMTASAIRKYISDGKKLALTDNTNTNENADTTNTENADTTNTENADTTNTENADTTNTENADTTNTENVSKGVEIVPATKKSPKQIKGRKFTITVNSDDTINKMEIFDAYGMHELALYLLENKIEVNNIEIVF